MNRGSLYRYPQPYRGQPRPKYPRPRRQIRNLRLEKLENTRTIISSYVVMGLIGIGLTIFSRRASPVLIAAVFLVLLSFATIFSLAVADGINSINRFREGYDFDSSVLERPKELEKDKVRDEE